MVKLHHSPQIDRTENIDVIQDEGSWFSGMSPGVFEERRSFLQPAASIEQYIFARDLNVHPEIIIRLQVVDDHVGEVMDVDDYLANPKRAHSRKRDLEQRPPTN